MPFCQYSPQHFNPGVSKSLAKMQARVSGSSRRTFMQISLLLLTRLQCTSSHSLAWGMTLFLLEEGGKPNQCLPPPFLASSVSEIAESLGGQFGCLLSTRQWIFNTYRVSIYRSFMTKFLQFWKRHLSWLRTPSTQEMKLYFVSSRREFSGELNRQGKKH